MTSPSAAAPVVVVVVVVLPLPPVTTGGTEPIDTSSVENATREPDFFLAAAVGVEGSCSFTELVFHLMPQALHTLMIEIFQHDDDTSCQSFSGGHTGDVLSLDVRLSP